MTTPAQDLPIVLYHYHLSPYARKVVWYLTLRKIPFSQCLQPPILPRPDVAVLGIAYRRIPLMSIGRDVYLDTRLILAKLEQLYPPGASHPGLLSANDPDRDRALAHLLSQRAAALFTRAAQLLPAAQVSNPAFVRDRAALMGIDADKPEGLAAAPLAPANLAKQRPGALVEARDAVAFLEETLLADGREWISPIEMKVGGGKMNKNGPSLVDIEAVWLWHWLNGIPEALSPEVIGKDSFPKVFAWMDRFDAFLKEGTKEQGAPRTLGGEPAAELIARASFAEPEGQVDAADPVVIAEGFEKGQSVLLWPTDYGFLNKDKGQLVGMDKTEYVIETQSKFGSIRVHAPRIGFRVGKAGGGAASKM
ncbi:hypothetical protein F5X99DRAFT_410610 [Biscogniauxia marginata]|nr:hypothetical protein F5X99DRAFT_410610 [Biscogniauxia marginata]